MLVNSVIALSLLIAAFTPEVWADELPTQQHIDDMSTQDGFDTTPGKKLHKVMEPDGSKECSTRISDTEGDINDDALPIYVSTRGAVVIPAKAYQDSHALGAGFGLVSDEKSFFGLRVVWLPDPPAEALSREMPNISNAWGPLVEWQNMFSPSMRLSFFSNLAAGFVYGTPNASNRDPEDTPEQNVILPLLEIGVGMRITSRPLKGYRGFIAPEFGYVPSADAPYAALSVGLY